MKRSWLLALAIIITHTASFAQTILSVNVQHAEWKTPVQNAVVTILSLHRSLKTNEQGIARFENILPGEYRITVANDAFKQVEKSVIISHESAVVEIFLEEKIYHASPMEVNALRVTERFSPVTFSEYKSVDIREQHYVQDIPELLSMMPSTTWYSENGNGIGYNYLRIRGFDQRRLAVMVNGIPQNDPEDHNVYWLDFSDILGSTENIQVQRGAGSAFYGPPAIGGSINIITGDFSDQKGIRISSGIGTDDLSDGSGLRANTWRHAFSYGSGVIDGRYSFYGRLSKTKSDGYREKSWTDFNSYFVTASRYDETMTTRINLYGGPISDGLAYNGIAKFAIKDNNLRRANYNYWEANDTGYTYAQARRQQETEHFSQPHFELLHEWRLAENLTLNNSIFYVLGEGYFDYDGTGYTDTTYYRMTSPYGFLNAPNPINPIIRAFVDNVQFGWLPRMRMKHTDGEFTAGLELRRHRSLHWGKILWAENLPANLDPDRHYYEYRGGKDVASLYAQEMYLLHPQMNIMGSLQYVFNRYYIFDEKFVGTDFHVDYHFFNPRIGLNYNVDERVNLYTNISYTSREPRLKNLYDAAESSGGATPQFEPMPNGQSDFTKPLVKPEHLINIELGAGYREALWFVHVNAYLMNFENEIIKSGQLDRFGQPITGNAERTQHLGIEISASADLTPNLTLEANGLLSRNRLIDHSVFTKDGAGKYVLTSLNDNPIAGFPDHLGNIKATYRQGDFTFSLSGKFVGAQYTDNFKNESNKVDAYAVLNGSCGYRLPGIAGLRSVEFRITANNLTNNLYAMSGEGKEFFVAAGRNYFFDLSIEL